MVLMKLFAGLQWRRRHREQTYGHGRREGRRGWKEWRDYHGNIHITTCKIDVQWEFAVWLRELKPRLCNNLEGWEGLEVRGRSRGRGHMSTYDWLMLMYGRNIVMQYYKAMLLQLKMSKFKSEKKKKKTCVLPIHPSLSMKPLATSGVFTALLFCLFQNVI